MKNTLNKYSLNKELLLSIIIIAVLFFIDKRDVLIQISLTADEILSWKHALTPFSEFYRAIYENTHQFLYYFILKIWSFFVPSNDYWIRVPALAFSIASLCLLFSFFYKKEKTILPFSVLLLVCFDPLFSYLSTFNRPYSLIFLISLISSIALIDFKKETSRRVWIISTLALLFTHHLAVLFLFCQLLYLLIKKEDLLSLLKKNLYCVPFLIIYIIQFISQARSQSHRIDWIASDFSSLELNYTIPVIYLLSLLILRKSILNGAKDKLFLIVPILFLTLVTVINFSIRPFFVGRYFFIIYPLMFLSIGYALKDILDRKKISPIVVLLLVLISIRGQSIKTTVSNPHYYFTPDFKKFFFNLRESGKIQKETVISCIYKETYPNLLIPYSYMHFQRDICSNHTNIRDVTSNFKDTAHMIIHIDNSRPGNGKLSIEMGRLR